MIQTMSCAVARMTSSSVPLEDFEILVIRNCIRLVGKNRKMAISVCHFIHESFSYILISVDGLLTV